MKTKHYESTAQRHWRFFAGKPVLSIFILVGFMALDHSIVAQVAPTTATVENDSEPIDLTEFYGTVPGSDGDTWFSHNDWKGVPKGLQTFNGILFDISGNLLLRGQHAMQLDTETREIPIQGSYRYVHLLHGTGFKESDGTPIGSLVINYVNGESAELPIVYGHHLRNWWKEPSERKSETQDPGTAIAWQGPSPTGFPALPVTLRLYQTALLNPHPEREIRSIILKSKVTDVTWFIASASCGNSKPSSESE